MSIPLGIPCKKDKCISYPVCISKEVIYCVPLYNWIGLNGHTEGNWKHIEKHFTSIRIVRHSHNTGASYIGRSQFSFMDLKT